MALTMKQEKFAQGIIDGLNQTAAYRLAYDTERMAPSTIWTNAYDLVNNRAVAARIQELRDELAAEILWDRKRIVTEATKNLELARDLKQVAPANGALSIIVDVQGLKVSKVEHSGVVNHAISGQVDVVQLQARADAILEALNPGHIIEGEVVEDVVNEEDLLPEDNV